MDAAKAILAVFLTMAIAAIAKAEPPQHAAEVAAWAQSGGFRLDSGAPCQSIEERDFGALGSICWHARQRAPIPRTRYFPRLEITLATYKDAAAARARMARFHEIPRSLRGEAGKVYPLRAGFRLGNDVVIVTTDASLFEADVNRAAAQLAHKLGGTVY